MKHFKYLLYLLLFVSLLSTASCGSSGGDDDDDDKKKTEEEEEEGYKDTFNLEIGDECPGGGYVFYINTDADKDGWKYLSVAPASSEVDSLAFGTYAYSSSVPYPETSEEIGAGKDNTALIIDHYGPDYVGANYTPDLEDTAAYFCDNLDLGGKTDWFLPSIEELKLIVDITDADYKLTDGKGYWSSHNLQIDDDGADELACRTRSWSIPTTHDVDNLGKPFKNTQDPGYVTRAVRMF